MTVTINPDRLAELEAATLASGSHGSSFSGEACALEWVSLLADEGMTDAPACASPVLARYTIRLNDRWSTERRQSLKPFLPRMVGTGNDGKDSARIEIASRMLCTEILGPWLRLAGMDERADALTALVAATPEELRSALWEIRNEAWRKRDEHQDSLKAKILERLKDRPVADADAVADAVADADADAVADAVAGADADADADAVADAGKGSYWPAYYAACDYFRDNPLPVMDKIRALNAEQAPLALVLLDRMIDPEVTA